VTKLDGQWLQMLDAGYDERNMYLTKMSWPCYDGKEQCLDD
ncbi:hypothetical protein PF011_g27593, partial [Phytophthora fragariae]